MDEKEEKWDKAAWMKAFAGFQALFGTDWDPMSPQAPDEVSVKAIEIVNRIAQAGPQDEPILAVIAKKAGASIKKANELQDYFEMFVDYDRKYREKSEEKDRIARSIAAKDVIVLLTHLGSTEKLAEVLAGEAPSEPQ